MINVDEYKLCGWVNLHLADRLEVGDELNHSPKFPTLRSLTHEKNGFI